MSLIKQSWPVLLLLLPILLGAGRPMGDEDSGFWNRVVDPGRKKYQEAIKRGTSLLERAEKTPPGSLRTRLLEDALAAFREGNRASPNKAEGWYQTGKVLYELDRTKAAIRILSKVRRLDPKFSLAFDVSFKLGIAYSKLGQFERAVLEYDRAERELIKLEGRSSPNTRATRAILNGNAAEALMALERLDEAIQRYKEALSIVEGYRLARWGLAVAYDRDEQISKATQEVQAALASDPQMSELTKDNVFFIPEGDIHYYYALGYLVQGKTTESQKHWEQFLAKLPDSPWIPRARAHVDQLGGGQKQELRKGRLAPVPSSRVAKNELAFQDRRNIRYRVQSNIYKLRRCYAKQLSRKPGLTGRMRVGFVVDPSGRVRNARLVRSSFDNSSLHRCVLDVFRTINFSRPSSGRSIRMTYPIEFKP